MDCKTESGCEVDSCESDACKTTMTVIRIVGLIIALATLSALLFW